MNKIPTENKNATCVSETTSFNQLIDDPSKDVSLKIKQEELDISKRWMQTGGINVHRESFTINKNFTIPIEHVDLVIEKKDLSSAIPDNKDISPEIIRIPLSEENVEFTKHKVSLEDVSIYKQKIEDIKEIETTLKREEPTIKISTSLQVKDE
ncbi:YsnF/AvaK domain-containing protein [Clostridium algoriphilum]|uniref:YsnF/AvaK domain-containing protein n=1 Tax=Clostridium algoriphilum TaxID=198347 RepID=UPI001CF333CD|nr:YsnF/AvaK domain-containing protein [Clostridium algoriphilum]MCB2294922.1 YsnF/AvaK domain-containing protein [Clostridium algoriphilum]